MLRLRAANERGGGDDGEIAAKVAKCVASMRNHPAEAELLAASCGYLRSFVNDDASRKVAVDGGAVAAVVAAMRRHTVHVGLQRRGCVALLCLLMGDAAGDQANRTEPGLKAAQELAEITGFNIDRCLLAGEALATAPAAAEEEEEEEEEEEDCSSADDGEGGGEDGGEDEAAWAAGGEACDEATWAILAHLLGFAHAFEPSHCARVLYDSLSPALLSHPTLLDRVRPLVATLARAALLSSRLNFATEVAPSPSPSPSPSA